MTKAGRTTRDCADIPFASIVVTAATRAALRARALDPPRVGVRSGCASSRYAVSRGASTASRRAAVAGKHVMAFKLKAFAASAGILGLAGRLYGDYTSCIAPGIFTPLLTICIVLALVAGGVGNNRGAAIRGLLVSLGLIVVLRVRPSGLVPERLPRVELPDLAASSPSGAEG